jgi:putative SOS response-associated peptidase YedK
VCGQFTITLIDDIIGRFNVVSTDGNDLVPRWNAAPTQEIPVVLERKNGRELRLVQWGFQPSWVRQLPKPTATNQRTR